MFVCHTILELTLSLHHTRYIDTDLDMLRLVMEYLFSDNLTTLVVTVYTRAYNWVK